jgi:hypothetical protein
MMRQQIEPGSAVEVCFTLRERELILAHTFAGRNLTARLRLAAVTGTQLAVHYKLDDLDELVGYIAAEANHCEDMALQGELDALHERLQDEMATYDDGGWQESF